MRIALLVLLAACSGSGGSSPRPFSPSSNIAATHPFLLGFWSGDLTEIGQPNTVASLNITAPGLDGYTMDLGFLAATEFQAGPGNIRADGDRFLVLVQTTTPTGGNVTIEGTIVGQDELRGTWKGYRRLPGVPLDAPPDATGTVRLTRTGPPMLSPQLRLEESVYDSPDLLLVVRREWR